MNDLALRSSIIVITKPAAISVATNLGAYIKCVMAEE